MSHRTPLWIASLVFFCLVAGLLVWRRFDVPPQLPVTVVAAEHSNYKPGDRFKRGHIFETSEQEWLVLTIGDDIQLALDEKTRLELHRLFDEERVLNLTRGRILLNNSSKTPIFIDTNQTENAVTKGVATFINYDFQQMVTIAPIIGSIQTTIKQSGEYLSVRSALNIHETIEPSFEPTTVLLTEGMAAPFYAWAQQYLPITFIE